MLDELTKLQEIKMIAKIMLDPENQPPQWAIKEAWDMIKDIESGEVV